MTRCDSHSKYLKRLTVLCLNDLNNFLKKIRQLNFQKAA